MYTENAASNSENRSEIQKILAQDDSAKSDKIKGRQNLLIMTLFSLLVMFTAVGLIYYYVKVDPQVVHENDQTTQVSENEGYVNPGSLQKLEHDASKISVKPVENSTAFIVCGAVFMVVMAGAFIYVKVVENKDDN